MKSVTATHSIPLFSSLGDEKLNQIITQSSLKSYPAYSTVINEGEECRALYIIISGKVKLTSASRDGREIILRFLNANDFFGDVFSSGELSHNSTVTTLSSTEMLIIQKSDLHRYLLLDPPLSIKFLEEMAIRLGRADFKIHLFSFTTAQFKIAALILQMAIKEGRISGSSVEFEKFPRYSDIAAMAGITRETVSRILHSFENKKLIRLGKLKLTIIDYEKFRGMFDITGFRPDTKAGAKSKTDHFQRKGRIRAFSMPELNKIQMKYSYPKIASAISNRAKRKEE